MLAEMHASIEASRWWTYRVASKQDQGDDIAVDSASLSSLLFQPFRRLPERPYRYMALMDTVKTTK